MPAPTPHAHAHAHAHVHAHAHIHAAADIGHTHLRQRRSDRSVVDAGTGLDDDVTGIVSPGPGSVIPAVADAVLGVADKVIEAVKAGQIKHFFLIDGQGNILQQWLGPVTADQFRTAFDTNLQ